MNLGTFPLKAFKAAVILGSLSFSVSFLLAMSGTDTPYQFGRAGFAWLIVQLMTGVVLIYSGMFGIMTAGATEISAKYYNMNVLWAMFVVLFVLFCGSLWLCYSDLMPVTVDPNWADDTVAWTGLITAGIAIIAYVQACRYFLRIHRLRNTKFSY